VSQEFHDLSEEFLNSKNQYWGNLGFWQSSNNYSSACSALANELAFAVQLDDASNVFDAGFGCGDQLLLWLKKYQVNSVQGINYSDSQTRIAKKRLVESGFNQFENQISYGSVTDMDEYASSHRSAGINKVLALDCAYHFPSRIQFFNSSYKKLNDSGQLGLTDILLSDNQIPLIQRLVLHTMLFLSRIPKENIVTLDSYRKELSDIGFENICIRDISEQVFTPFSDWLYEFKKGEGRLKSTSKLAWLKYDITAKFLKWADRNNILRYAIITADKPVR
jgi:cyclopropane fatty-acyl-phospholipid synthase-like methyltransferase